MQQYIKKFRHLDILTKKRISSGFLGSFKSVFKGNGLTFSDFKVREEGEDTTRIDWLVSAREGKILVRKMEEERELSIVFVLDVHSGMDFGFGKTKKEMLFESFFLLGMSAITDKDTIATYICGGSKTLFFPFSKTKEAFFKAFYEVLQYDVSQKKAKLIDVFTQIYSLKFKRKLIFVMTDSLDIDEEKIKKLCFQNEVVFVHIFHSFENTLDHHGIENINIYGETEDALNVSLTDEVKKKEFVELRKRKIVAFQKVLEKYGAYSLVVTEKEDVFATFSSFLHKKNTY